LVSVVGGVDDMPRDRVTRSQSAQADKTGKDQPNPTMCKEGKGVRNFACGYYDSCLDKAAKGMWSGFTCRECNFNYQKEEEPPSGLNS
jgi:hypothetical protein